MAFFNKTEDNHSRLDWQILQNGWTSLYLNKEFLKEDIQWFVKENFKIITMDCSGWIDKTTIHQGISKGLGFPDYYGMNLDALNDCVWQLEIEQAGLVIVFVSFEVVEKEYAYQLLDIFACNSRQHALFGDKLITLVQVNDGRYECEPVGASPVIWNQREWLNKSRNIISQ